MEFKDNLISNFFEDVNVQIIALNPTPQSYNNVYILIGYTVKKKFPQRILGIN